MESSASGRKKSSESYESGNGVSWFVVIVISVGGAIEGGLGGFGVDSYRWVVGAVVVLAPAIPAPAVIVQSCQC